MCVVFGFTAPSRLFHYFTGESKYCSANNSKEAFRDQNRNEKIIIFFFFCGFGFTAPSGLFHYFKVKINTVQQINKIGVLSPKTE